MTNTTKLNFTLIVVLLAGIAYNISQHNTPPLKTELSAPVVIELFSSTRCPSCPAAERILNQLTADPNVFAISCHVPYLDLGEKRDPFSRDFCEVRHHGYADLLTSRRIYTPFMVMNGAHSLTGNRAGPVVSALEEATEKPPALIEIAEGENRVLDIQLPGLEINQSMRVWVYGFDPKNTGPEGHHVTNAALSLDNLGSWGGAPENRRMEIHDPDIRSVLVVAQEGGYGRIAAAGKLNLK
jgi:hypothetical protein